MHKVLRSTEFNVAASAVATGLATALSYAWLGFVGITLVGLSLGFVAVRVELGTQDPIGLLGLETRTPEERAEIRARVAATAKVLAAAKTLGLVLTLVGGLGFFLLQLPR